MTVETPQKTRLQKMADEVRQNRTAWLERHDMPISHEFIEFANSLGDMLEEIDKSGGTNDKRS